MSLFEVALEYASHRALSWGRMLVLARTDSGFGYRVILGKREPVPVLSVPLLAVESTSLALLSWLFARHSIYVDGGGPVITPSIAQLTWSEAEVIYSDLCLLTDVPRDPEALLRQRQAISLAS
jgi:hypothetical protein